MIKLLSALLLAGCAASPKHKGIAEVSPLGNAPGEVRYANPQELSERKGSSDASDTPVGGHIQYTFAEYILSGAVGDSISVNAAVIVGEAEIDVDCTNNSSFSPTPTNEMSLSKLHTRQAGLQRTELDCDILDSVGDEFLFVVTSGTSEKKFRIKTNTKPE